MFEIYFKKLEQHYEQVTLTHKWVPPPLIIYVIFNFLCIFISSNERNEENYK